MYGRPRLRIPTAAFVDVQYPGNLCVYEEAKMFMFLFEKAHKHTKRASLSSLFVMSLYPPCQ